MRMPPLSYGNETGLYFKVQEGVLYIRPIGKVTLAIHRLSLASHITVKT